MLLKTFKYFDLNGNGELELEEFKRVLDKLGIVGFDDNYLEEVFYLYANKINSSISYKSFIKELFHGVTNKFESIVPILEKLKICFYNAGLNETIKLLSAFRNRAGEDNKGVLPAAFEEINKKFTLNLKNDEIEKLYYAFYEVNTINYKQLFNAIIGNLSPERENVINDTLKIIYSEDMTLDDLFSLYNAEEHPQTEKGADAEDLNADFRRNYKIVNNAFSVIPSDEFNPEIFVQYYSIISFFISGENEFKATVQQPFQLKSIINKKNKSKKKKVTEDKGDDFNKDECPVIASSHLKTLSALKNKLLKLNKYFFLQLNNQFLSMDKTKNKLLNFDSFEKAIKATKVGVIKNELSYIYGLFENKSTGLVNYEYFLRVMIDMNHRIPIISKVFNKLESKNIRKSDLTIEFILGQFDASSHPDIEGGDETEETILDDLEEALRMNFEGDIPKNAGKEYFIYK